MTNRNPLDRARELSDTSSPHPHKVEYSVLVENPGQIEQEFHRENEDARVSRNREWFDLEVAVAKSKLVGIVGERGISENTSLNAKDIKKLESDHQYLIDEYVERISVVFKQKVSDEMEMIRTAKRDYEIRCT